MKNFRKIAPWLGVFVVGCMVYAALTLEKVPAVPKQGDDIVASDYSQRDNWIFASKGISPVDIFYLYPTVWSRGMDDKYPVCTIDNPLMRRGAQAVVQNQAGIFLTTGRIFAPYYRLLDASFLLAQKPEDQAAYIAGIPGHDVEAAFDYYIQHYNEGRPFILLGHSQGAAVLKTLLFGYMKEHPEIYKRMVAAYVIGYSVTGKELEDNPHLRFAEAANDVGVIVSYNTEAPGMVANNPVVMPGAIAINPLNWSREEDYAPSTLNRGSLQVDSIRGPILVQGQADARVDLKRGVVICGTLSVADYGASGSLFPAESFHFHDISIYAGNLIDNMMTRTIQLLDGKWPSPGL